MSLSAAVDQLHSALIAEVSRIEDERDLFCSALEVIRGTPPDEKGAFERIHNVATLALNGKATGSARDLAAENERLRKALEELRRQAQTLAAGAVDLDSDAEMMTAGTVRMIAALFDDIARAALAGKDET